MELFVILMFFLLFIRCVGLYATWFSRTEVWEGTEHKPYILAMP